jgi:ATP-dependent Lon protease
MTSESEYSASDSESSGYYSEEEESLDLSEIVFRPSKRIKIDESDEEEITFSTKNNHTLGIIPDFAFILANHLKRKSEQSQEQCNIQQNTEKSQIQASTSTIHEKILLSKFPEELKEKLISKIDNPYLDRSDKNKASAWVSEALKLPIGVIKEIKYKNINKFLTLAREKLDKAVYGMESTKEEIIDFLCNYISNECDANGTVLALNGAKGMGKTRICRALADILGIPFFQLSMGGLTDSSVLLGHDSTYIGAKCGRIAYFMQKAKCMNFIIYIDEMDKSGSEGKAKEVQGVLTHMLDETQNKEFQDIYFEGIPLDLSKVLFITSFNNPEDVDPIVLNRMKIINISELTVDEKVKISEMHILPEINKTNNFKFSEEILKYIINFKVSKESGMRNIKKCLETIVNRLNTLLLMNQCDNKRQIIKNFSYEKLLEEMIIKKETVVNKKIVDSIIKNSSSSVEELWRHMYI